MISNCANVHEKPLTPFAFLTKVKQHEDGVLMHKRSVTTTDGAGVSSAREL